jgi:hypothetical protein
LTTTPGFGGNGFEVEIPGEFPASAEPLDPRLIIEEIVVPQPQSRRGRRPLRRFAVFVVLICVFTGILYGTASYMRGHNFLSEIKNPFRSQTGVANTDIYLRPAPNTDNDPIGLVTKNSKVRIVNSQNNWYQVDVIEQGRERPNMPNITRGWLNGKYLEVGDN